MFVITLFELIVHSHTQMHQKENNLPVCPWVLNLVRHAGNINVVLSGDYFPPQKKKKSSGGKVQSEMWAWV